MPGKKYYAKRYYDYFAMLGAMLNYNSNALFKSIFDGEDVRVPLNGGGSFSLKGTIGAIIDTVNDIKLFQKEKMVNGELIAEPNYEGSAEKSKLNEEELSRLRTEFNDAFKAYKDANKTAQDEKYMEEYKKFEYMENVFRLYDAFQKDFEIYEKAQGPDMPEDADLVFDDKPEADTVNKWLATYKKEQGQFYASMDRLNNYLDSAKYDPELLSEKFRDMDITAQTLLDEGRINDFKADISAAIQSKESEIEILKNETQEKLDSAYKSYIDVINKYQEEKDRALDKYTKENYDKEVGVQREFHDNISKLVVEAENDKTALNNTIEKINVCRDQKFANVSSVFKINESDFTDLTDGQIDTYVAANNKNIENIRQNNEVIAASIKELQEKIEEQDKEAKRLAEEGSDKAYENRKDVIDLNKDIKAAQDKADLAKQILKNANKRGGIKNITGEELRSIGVNQAVQWALGSNTQANDAVQAIIGVVGNDLRNNSFFRKTNTVLSDNLGAAIKSLDSILDRENGTLNKAIEEYKTKNPDFEFKLHARIERQLDTLSDFAGEKRRGQIYDAEDALAVYDLYKINDYLTNMANGLPEDPAFEGIKAELGKDVKALIAVCDNDKISGKFTDVASHLFEYGTQADRSDKIKASIQNVIDSSEKTAKELQEKKEYEQLKLINDSNQLKAKIDENKAELEKLQKQYAADKLTGEYLEAANEAYNSVKGINANKQLINERKLAAEETKKKIFAGEKKIADSQEAIQNEYKEIINKKKSEYETQRKNIGKAAGHKYNSLMTEKENLKGLQEHVNALDGKTVNMQSTVRVLASCQKSFAEKSEKAIDRLNLSKKAVMDELNKIEQTLYERLAGTKKKFFSDSNEFTRMKEEIDAYIKGCAGDDNRTLDTNVFGAKIAQAKQAIQAYIGKRDDSKWTESGQIRLDTAKQLLQMFNTKEQVLNQYASEKAQIQHNKSTVGKMEVLSETEEKLVRSADPENPFTDFNKNLMAPAQRRFREGLGKIQEIFEPLKEGLAEKSQYINQLVEKGVNGLAKGNIKAFTEGVASIMALKEIEERNQLKAFNAKPEAIDMLRKLYSSSPEVQDMAKQLVTQTLQPKAFMESLSPQRVKEIRDRSVENAKQKDHKIDELNLTNLN